MLTEAACRLLAKEFYGRVAANQELKPLFPGKSLRCATEEFAAFLIQFLDGDPEQTQYRWWLSLRESHSRFNITEQHRTTWLRLMSESIDAAIEDESMRAAWRQFFQVSSAYIGGQANEDPEHSELKVRWRRQQMLDQLIDALVNERDLEIMELANHFTSRPSVFVGILARMMKTEREALLEYTLHSIANDPALTEARFNGRTLLHFAAGHACLPVVQLLLSQGVDPDVLDSGNHTPLYRAASSAHAAKVVQALIDAGANPNHPAGINRSSPLHQAARFGTLEVAKTLVAAGASPSTRDKNGLTPHDRAVNCRRHDVADLLASIASQ